MIIGTTVLMLHNSILLHFLLHVDRDCIHRYRVLWNLKWTFENNWKHYAYYKFYVRLNVQYYGKWTFFDIWHCKLERVSYLSYFITTTLKEKTYLTSIIHCNTTFFKIKKSLSCRKTSYNIGKSYNSVVSKLCNAPPMGVRIGLFFF